MRAIALNIVILMYGLTFATVLVESYFDSVGVELLAYDGRPLEIMDENGNTKRVTPTELLEEYTKGTVTLSDASVNPQDQGEIVDRVAFFSTAGFAAVWALILLLSGAYTFMWLNAMGIPGEIVVLAQIFYPIALAVTVIKFIRGVE